jgi:hypothetical protein
MPIKLFKIKEETIIKKEAVSHSVRNFKKIKS